MSLHRILSAATTLAVSLALLASIVGSAGAQIQPKLATNPTRLQLFQGDGTNFVLVNSMFYEVKRTGQMITVPAGFVTDFASVPWYGRWFINVLGKHSIPAIVHDYLYWEQRCTRDEADAILQEAMGEYSSSSIDQTVVFYAVKYGAQSAWDDNTKDRANGYIRVLTGAYQNIPLNTDWDAYRKQLHDQHVTEPPIEPGKPAYCTLPSK